MCNFPRLPQALRRVIMMRARKLTSTEVIITPNVLQLLNTLLGRNLSILIQLCTINWCFVCNTMCAREPWACVELGDDTHAPLSYSNQGVGCLSKRAYQELDTEDCHHAGAEFGGAGCCAYAPLAKFFGTFPCPALSSNRGCFLREIIVNVLRLPQSQFVLLLENWLCFWPSPQLGTREAQACQMLPAYTRS